MSRSVQESTLAPSALTITSVPPSLSALRHTLLYVGWQFQVIAVQCRFLGCDCHARVFTAGVYTQHDGLFHPAGWFSCQLHCEYTEFSPHRFRLAFPYPPSCTRCFGGHQRLTVGSKNRHSWVGDNPPLGVFAFSRKRPFPRERMGCVASRGGEARMPGASSIRAWS